MVEDPHALLPILCLSATIKPQVSDASEVKVALHNIHEVSHLSEDQYSVLELEQLGKYPIDELELTTGTDHQGVISEVIVIFKEEVRVVAALAQLHH